MPTVRAPKRRWCALFFFLFAIAIFPVAAGAQAPDPDPASVIPDPLDRGDHTIGTIDPIKLGTVPLQEPNSSGGPATGVAANTDLEIRGVLYRPTDLTQPSPLIVLVHGNHGSCDSGSAPACTIFKRNDEGYAYLGENLASWGYTVFSLDQDQLIYYQDSAKGKGMHQRRLLIAGALDKFTQANATGGLPAGPNSNITTELVGKLDMNRIGLMGHSRGGDGISSFLDYNRMRDVGTRYPIRGAISLAPVDYERKAPYGTPYLTILPFCDGDVSNLQGARFYERSQYIKGDDPFPRIQMSVMGGNHNYFNSVWFADNDDSTGTDAGCASPGTASATSSRLSGDASGDTDQTNNSYKIDNTDKLNPNVNTRISGDPARMGDQEKIGLATMSAFFRRYVGGEGAFDPYMTGELSLTASHEQLPHSACPTSTTGLRMDCDERLSTSYFPPETERVDVIRPETDNPTGLSALGTKLSSSGFANPYLDGGGVTPKPATTSSGLDWCNPEPLNFAPGQLGISGNALANRACPLPAPGALGGQNGTRENSPINQSYGRQLAIAWDNPRGGDGSGAPAKLSTTIPAADSDVSDLKSLTMGADVNFFDPRNPARTGTNAEFNPEVTTQDFSIALTDADGTEATVSAADPRYGNALHQTTGSTTPKVHVILDQIRIPLSDFADEGVDLENVSKIEMIFGDEGMPQTGSIQLADVRFQEADTDPSILVDSMEPDAGPGTGPVTSGPDPAAELTKFDPSQGNQKLPDVVLSSDRATTWTVDDDKAQCPNAGFTSIQAAIDQAAPWDTVVVCAGLYEESSTPVFQASNPVSTGSMNGLTITKPIKIKGAGADKVTITPDPDLGPTLAGASPYLRDGGGNVITISRQSLGSTDDNEEFVDISGVTITSPNVYAEAGVSYFNASGRISNSVVGPFKKATTAGELSDNPHGWGVIATNTLIGAGTGTVQRQVTVDDSKVIGYQSGGILIDGARGPDGNPDNTVRQGIRTFGFVTDTVVKGSTSTLFPQTGIKYASGARGFVKRSRITGNFFRSDQRQSVGVLLTDAATEATTPASDGFVGVTGSILTGNGYGVFNANAGNTGIRTGAPATATGNYWGPNAPAPGPSNPSTGVEGYSENEPAAGTPPVAAPTVIVSGRLTTPPAIPTDYTPVADAAPTGSIVNPGDGDEVPYDEELTPVVKSNDDFAVTSVTLTADGEALGTDSTAPYEFGYTPTVDEAGETVTLEATITDSSGQTATDSIDVDVAEEPVDPDPVDPTPTDPTPVPDNPTNPDEPAPGVDATLKFGRLVKDKAKGKAKLPVTVNGPGTVTLTGDGLRKVAKAPQSARELKLAIKPKRSLKRSLKQKGSTTVAIEVTFDPDEGKTIVKSRKVRLIRK